ncbi:MAG TPA: radical SAM protein [Gemmataceae bacterium]|nr:radical SAM protein [Gemmataceae bacterium]
MSFQRALALAERHPHDFTLQYPPRREFFQERYRVQDSLPPLRGLSPVLLYVHVPFCEAKCYYCNFAVDTRQEEGLHHRYVEALRRQLDAVLPTLDAGAVVGGIDVGGGTPTLLAAPLLRRLLAALAPWRSRAATRWPVSVETTPRIAAAYPERMEILAEGGVDRVSVGLQSTNDALLADVNRVAQAALGERAVVGLHRTGFRRVNVDLIFGLPGQTAACWQADLDRVEALPVDSITTYDCLYRGKGRRLTRRAGRPGPEVYGDLYDLGYERLRAAGFHAPYGSVNFSRHADETGTSPYFEGRLLDGLSYIGLGNYASSLGGEHWWFAPYRVNDWLKAVEKGVVLPVGDLYRLPAGEHMAKYLLLSLSFGFLDPSRFRRRFGLELSDIHGPALEYARQQGWLRLVDGVFALAPGAFRYLPKVRSLFYSEVATTWLEDRDVEAGSASDGRRGAADDPVLTDRGVP